MKYAAYKDYKPSGSDWLGNIPTHWNASPLKHAANIQTGYAFSSDDFTDEGIPVLRISDITKEGKVDLSNAKFLPIEYASEFRSVTLKNGDIVMAMTGATIGKVGRYESETPCLLNQRVCSFEAIKNNDQKYIWFLLNSDFYTKHIALTAFGGAQPNISDTQLLACDAPLPPIEEQQTIARFLDAKTAQIDTLVTKKRQLIEKLKEKRSALISRTVTRGLPPEAAKAAGLEPNPELKNSGVAWLDKYPSTWPLVPLKHLASIRYGIGEPPEYIDDGVPLIRATNVNAGIIQSKNLVRVNPSDIPAKRITWLSEGDIIVVRSGAYTADSARIPAKFSGAIAGFDMVVSPKTINDRFLAYCILSRYFKEGQLDTQKMRAAQPHLNAEELGNSMICVPPFQTQTLIADFLDQESALIDKLINKTETAIQKLTEYRQALITAAVTGKIDVREAIA